MASSNLGKRNKSTIQSARCKQSFLSDSGSCPDPGSRTQGKVRNKEEVINKHLESAWNAAAVNRSALTSLENCGRSVSHLERPRIWCEAPSFTRLCTRSSSTFSNSPPSVIQIPISMHSGSIINIIRIIRIMRIET